jgi:hypothetical protein
MGVLYSDVRMADHLGEKHYQQVTEGEGPGARVEEIEQDSRESR